VTAPAPRSPSSILVRPAAPADADVVRAIAMAAWRATYAGLLSSETIERFIAMAYPPERVALRIERHLVLVAGAPDGPIGAFVEVAERPDHVQLVAFYAHPEARGRGLGSALLERVRELHPDADLAADVLIGNELGEPFYAARGFEPGELLVEEVAGDEIRERRWWLRVNPA
jgi:GNAT superfamily N-acetyltransferase